MNPRSRPDLFAIVLAAGSGSRFGMPKALVPFGEETCLMLALKNLVSGGFSHLSVVIGAEADLVRSDAIERMGRFVDERGPHIEWVNNRDYEEGRIGSIAAGLRSAPESCRGALIHAVDFPLVRAETFRALAAAFHAGERPAELIFVPRQGSRRGHPVLMGRSIWPEVTALGPDEPLRRVVHADSGRLREIEVDDPGIHCNMNHPEDYEKVAATLSELAESHTRWNRMGTDP